MTQRFILVFLTPLIICLSLVIAEAQQNAFTYQGKLSDNGAPANGNYDLKFALFDSSTDGLEVRPPNTVLNVSVSGGTFTVTLNFGPTAFVGPPRFLEISARPAGAGAFTLLNPRQPINSTPYAIRSANSAAADVAGNAYQLGGVNATEYVRDFDQRLADARTPTAGSSNYIQNSSSPQAAANFNISGDGTAGGTLSANLVNSATQFNISGTPVFSVTGNGNGAMSNTFAGKGAGTLTAPSAGSAGHFNSFFGYTAGAANTLGAFNSFVGAFAGSQNTSGIGNSFFGMRAGGSNTIGGNNSFFGGQAGDLNTTGSFNSFFGVSAGRSNTSGGNNSFVGHSAGGNNLTGGGNTFVGECAGCANGSGSHNAFFGENAGTSNISESFNTFIGAAANGSTGIFNSTAIGAYAKVTQSNSLVLGSINGINGATTDTKVGIGLTSPTFKLQVIDPANTGLRVQTNAAGGTVASFGGFGDFSVDAMGQPSGRFVVKENGFVGIGSGSPGAKLDVNGNVKVGVLGSAGTTQLCWNSSGVISQCSSSLRYKTSFQPFTGGLNLINRLHPITFKWKTDQTLDLGLGAEDVAAVEPLLVNHNASGEVEGVKYDRLSAVFINAFKEQQTEIERQRAESKQQQDQILSLRMANDALSARLRSIERSLKRSAAARRRR